MEVVLAVDVDTCVPLVVAMLDAVEVAIVVACVVGARAVSHSVFSLMRLLLLLLSSCGCCVEVALTLYVDAGVDCVVASALAAAVDVGGRCCNFPCS